jgi:hypothetical protein
MARQQQTFEFMVDRPVIDTLDRPLPAQRKTAPSKKEQLPPERPQPKREEPQPKREEQRHEKRILDRSGILGQLRAKVGCISTAPEANCHATFSTGSETIDRWLPGGGLRVDAITEWVAEAEGSGAAALALIAAANHLRGHGRGPLVVVSDRPSFYPPAATALGIPAARIVWVCPSGHADRVWSIDQALRCESVAAVWAMLGAGLDDRDARRFQLAAEAGQTPGLFLRPATTRHRPSFAEIRLHVANHNHSRPLELDGLPDRGGGGRLLQVTLDRCRGGRLGAKAWIQIDDRGRITTARFERQDLEHPMGQHQVAAKDEEIALHLASKLAHPKTSTQRRAKRA